MAVILHLHNTFGRVSPSFARVFFFLAVTVLLTPASGGLALRCCSGSSSLPSHPPSCAHAEEFPAFARPLLRPLPFTSPPQKYRLPFSPAVHTANILLLDKRCQLPPLLSRCRCRYTATRSVTRHDRPSQRLCGELVRMFRLCGVARNRFFLFRAE